MSAGALYGYERYRRDEALDNLHSIYVDQWDGKSIAPEERTTAYLKTTVQAIVTLRLSYAGYRTCPFSSGRRTIVP
jgi:asparagine synthetase A